MSILKMDKIRLLGLSRDRTQIISSLQAMAKVELIDPKMETTAESNDQLDQEPVGTEMEQDKGQAVNTAERDQVQQNIQTLKAKAKTLEDAGKYLEDKYPNVQFDKGRLKISLAEFLAVADRENEIMTRARRVFEIDNLMTDLQAEIAKLEKEQAILQNCLELDLNLAQRSTARTVYFLASLDASQFKDLEAKLAENLPNAILLKLLDRESTVFVAAIALSQDGPDLDRFLKQNSFNLFPITKSGLPRQLFADNQEAIADCQQRFEQADLELKELAKRKLDFYSLYDYYLSMVARQEAVGQTENTAKTFMLEAYVPAESSARVKAELEDNFTVWVEIEVLPEDADYPILLKNKPFARAFQMILEMFGAPNTREIDPTPVLAPSTFIFFGMMLSDVGYGFLLTVACAYLIWKVKIDLKSESGSLVSLLFLCGISSTLWGFIFGGFFGDLLPVFTDNRINSPLLWFNPMDDPQKLLVWSMIFGLVHLFTGMAMKIVNEVRFGKVSNVFFDIVPWYLLIIGLGLILAGPSLGVAVVDLGLVGKYLALSGAAVIVLFSARSKKNPFARVFSGLTSLYGVVNYLGDILSYTRILALVLATSVIATVVNFLAKMVSGSLIGTVFAVLILLAGHLLNLALSALSAYVHSSRLQYVEFFGQFFEGGGTFFKPLSYQTKHIKIDNYEIEG